MIETMASLANTDGGTLFIGVDSNGSISGCYPFHGERTDAAELAMAVRHYTNPPLHVEVEKVTLDGAEVVTVTTAAHPSPVATTWGTYLTRRLNGQGVAETVGMDPTYLFTRYRDANGIDWALLPAVGATPEDIDRAAVQHFRDLAAARGGDALLAKRSDDGLVRSLGFRDDSPTPLTLGAIALFGRAEAIAKHLPYHQLVFSDRRHTYQTHRTSAPVALILHALHEQRATLGPAFPLAINVLTHRDYFQHGPVYVALEEEGGKKEAHGQVARAIVLV